MGLWGAPRSLGQPLYDVWATGHRLALWFWEVPGHVLLQDRDSSLGSKRTKRSRSANGRGSLEIMLPVVFSAKGQKPEVHTHTPSPSLGWPPIFSSGKYCRVMVLPRGTPSEMLTGCRHRSLPAHSGSRLGPAPSNRLSAQQTGDMSRHSRAIF